MTLPKLSRTRNLVDRRGVTLRRLARCWQNHDIDGVMACMTADCVYEASVGPEPGATLIGTEQVRVGILEMFAHDDGAESSVRNLIMAGDLAAWEWVYTWQHPSGHTKAIRGCDFFEFSGDKIRRKSGYRKTT